MSTFGYKQLLSEKQLLNVQVRARALMRTGSDLVAIYYKEKTLLFKTRSATDKNLIWTQTVEISDATMDAILSSKSFKSLEDLIKNSGLRVHCNCPAYHYWGIQYKATRLGYALVPEHRPPTVENRKAINIPMVCKHLYFVLQLYPFWSKALASKFKRYYLQKKEYEDSVQNLQRVRLNQNEQNVINSNISSSNEVELTEEDLLE